MTQFTLARVASPDKPSNGRMGVAAGLTAGERFTRW